MRCLIVNPGLKPDIADIPNTLEGLQAAVGGYIEVVPLADNAAMIVNEEGKLLNLRHNRRLSSPQNLHRRLPRRPTQPHVLPLSAPASLIT